MKTASLIAVLLLVSAPVMAEESPAPVSYSISEQQAQDYASRLDREIQQAKAQIQQLDVLVKADTASINAIVEQAKKRAEKKPE